MKTTLGHKKSLRIGGSSIKVSLPDQHKEKAALLEDGGAVLDVPNKANRATVAAPFCGAKSAGTQAGNLHRAARREGIDFIGQGQGASGCLHGDTHALVPAKASGDCRYF